MVHYAILSVCAKFYALVRKCTISWKIGHKPLHYSSRAVMQYIRAVNQGGWLARLSPVYTTPLIWIRKLARETRSESTYRGLQVGCHLQNAK